MITCESTALWTWPIFSQMIEVLLYHHMLERTELPLDPRCLQKPWLCRCAEKPHTLFVKSNASLRWMICERFSPCSHVRTTSCAVVLNEWMVILVTWWHLKFLSSHRQDLTMGGGHCGEGILKDRALWSWRMLEQWMDLPLPFFWMYLLSSLSIPSEKYTRVLENKTIQWALRKVHQRAQDSQRSIKDQGIWWCFMMFQYFLKPHMLSRSGACRRIHRKSEPRFCGGDHWSSWLKSSPLFRGVVQAVRALHLLNFKLAVATNSVLAKKARDCNTWI